MPKKWFSYYVTIVLISLVFSVLFWYYTPEKDKTSSYLSPITDALSLQKNNQVRLLDLWLPMIQESFGREAQTPHLTARSALVYDLTTNKTIYEKNADKRLPMASLTKIMTAIVSLENKRSDDTYTVYKEDLVGEDSMGLEPGEKLSLEELLYGLILNSGNDAAEVLAHNSPMGREAFLQAMNDKAQALGLSNTRYSNPSGLQGDGVQYTTAYDLLVVTRYALDTFPLFRTVAEQAEHTIPQNATHKEYTLFNETNLLTTYPGVKGVKTGYTPEAGMCLVTYLDYKGHRLIAIILNSENRREEMKELLDYSLKAIGVTPPQHS